MKYKHAFINASPLAYAEHGESHRSLDPPFHPCRITTGPDSKASDGPASTVQRDGNCPRVRSVKPRISFPADRVAAGEKETPEFFTDAPGDGCIGKTTGATAMNETPEPATKCTYCGKPADPVVNREIIDRAIHPGTNKKYVRTRSLPFCSKEHGSNYQMGCEG